MAARYVVASNDSSQESDDSSQDSDDSNLEVAPLPITRGWLRDKASSGEFVPLCQRPTSPLRPTPPRRQPLVPLPPLLSAAPPQQPQRPGEPEAVAPSHNSSRTASPSHSSHGQGDPRFSGVYLLDEVMVCTGGGKDGDSNVLYDPERIFN